MPMAIVLGILIAAAVLDPALAKRITDFIQNLGSAIVQGPINSATNAWIKVAVIAAGLGIGVWVLETKIAHKMGQEVSAPAVQPIPIAAPPSFGTGGGFSAAAGPVALHTGVTTSQGSAQYVNNTPNPPGFTPRAPRERSSRRGQRAYKAVPPGFHE